MWNTKSRDDKIKQSVNIEKKCSKQVEILELWQLELSS